MGRQAEYDKAALAAVVERQRGVITRGQALACGLTRSAVSHRVKDGGRWRTVLPGVYLTTGGELAGKQRVMAAILYGGPAIAVTGPAALSYYSIPGNSAGVIDLLVPLGCRRQDAGFVRLHRTSVVPERLFQDGPVRVVLPARAIADTARQLTDVSAVRAVVAAGVQRG